MDHQPFHNHVIEHASETGILWLILMIFNLLFTGSGLWLKQQSFHYSTNCSDTFIHILAARWKEELVLWSGVACYLAVGVICCCCCSVGWGTRNRWCRNILVLLAGALYLVGDNLGLVDNCFDFLRRCLLGLSLALAIALDAIRYLKDGLRENRGCAQQGLIHPCEMAVNTLYPMLMFTVHIDQTYTAIVGDVSHHKQAFQNGTKCPIVHVYVSIVFFILICIIWGGVVRTVADKYHKYICKFKEANPETDKMVHNHIAILVCCDFLYSCIRCTGQLGTLDMCDQFSFTGRLYCSWRNDYLCERERKLSCRPRCVHIPLNHCLHMLSC